MKDFANEVDSVCRKRPVTGAQHTDGWTETDRPARNDRSSTIRVNVMSLKTQLAPTPAAAVAASTRACATGHVETIDPRVPRQQTAHLQTWAVIVVEYTMEDGLHKA